MALDDKKKPLRKGIGKIRTALRTAMAGGVVAAAEGALNTDEEKNDASNIIVANSLPNAGNEILDGAIKDENTSFQELTNAAKIAKEADVEEQKIKTQTAQQNIDV